MVRIAGALAAVALMASAAAGDEYNQAVLKHDACTETAATELAKKEGNAVDLAREALRACTAEEAEVAKLASAEVMQQVLRNTMYLRIKTIHEVRAGPRTKICAACGMRPWTDPKTGVWKPYRL